MALCSCIYNPYDILQIGRHSFLINEQPFQDIVEEIHAGNYMHNVQMC